MKYYRLDKIHATCPDAKYYMVYSGRSDGKTFAVLEVILKNYCEGKGSGAIIRRMWEDFRGNTASNMFNGIVNQRLVEKYTHGQWTGVRYWSGKWYLTKENAKGETVTKKDPFCYAFALSRMEHDKSSSYDDVTTVLFDEFISRNIYLPDEFVLLMNTLSTIIRNRDNVTIYMMGNTVNPWNPYFGEMGLTRAKSQKQGTIDVYEYGQSGLKVAVEYAEKPNKSVPSNVYFAFNNPKLTMITSGAWEIAVYPHKPVDFRPKDIKFTYFIKYDDDMLQCEVVYYGNNDFTFIHRKTSDLKYPDKDLIYCPEYTPKQNWRRKLTKPTNRIEQGIAKYFSDDKVFYQDNEVGEVVRNYLMWCTTENPLKK